MQGSYFLNAGVLFKIAVTGYERTMAAPSDDAPNQNDAAVAILFCAAALEAIVMEIALLAKMEEGPATSPRVRALATILDELEDSRGSIRLKYQVAKMILTGESFVKGEAPYQDFDILIAMRDAIVHLKPENVATPPKVIQRLRDKGVLAKTDARQASSWLGQMSTRATARWACNVVANMVNAIREALASDASAPRSVAALFIGNRFDRVS